MALRPIGVYLLTSSALYAQKKTLFHVGKMTQLASESASLTMLAGEELESSIEMVEKAAVESEEGLELQSESIDLGFDADRKFAKAAEEMALAEKYKGEADMLHEQAAEKTSESEIATTNAKEHLAASDVSLTKAKEDRAAAVADKEKSVAFFEESSSAEEVTTGAKERAAEFEAIVLKREGQSVKDGESLVQTEVGALEDAETVAACTPIPLFNFVCEAFGAITEMALQGRAAAEGAKAAIESLSAASAQRKETAELAIALEEQEDAARFAAEGRNYQLLAEEKDTKASEEFAEAERLKVDAKNSEYLAESKKKEALNDGALAALDEDSAAQYFADSARDEAIGTEEKELSAIAQSEAREHLGSSTGEEFTANRLRLDADSKEAKAEKVMQSSIAHGTHAIGYVLQSLVTAILVIYVTVMRFVLHSFVPAIKRSFTSQSHITFVAFGEQVLLLGMHFAVMTVTFTMLVGRLSFGHIAIKSRWKAFVLLASAAGLIESSMYSLPEACYCRMNGKDANSTFIATTTSFGSNMVYLVPRFCLEYLTIFVLFGPNVFIQVHNTLAGNQVLLWVGLCLMNTLYIRLFKWKRMSSVAKPSYQTIKCKRKLENGVEEGYLCGNERNSLSALNTNNLDQADYGSMEEIALINYSTCSEGNTSYVSSKKRSTTCYQKFCQYCKSLCLSADLLMLSLMAMLVYHSWPLFKVLESVSKSFLGVAASLHHVPILLVGVILILIVHFMYVH